MPFKKGQPPWNKGKKSSKETIEKLKKTKKERNHPAWNKGLTKETDERVKNIKIWNKGLTKETSQKLKEMGQKISKSHKSNPLIGWPKGKKHSKETIEKISKTRKERNIRPWNYGLTKETDPRVAIIAKKQTGREKSEETKKKISDAKMRMPKERRIEISRSGGIASMSKLTMDEKIERGMKGYLMTPRKNSAIEKIVRQMLIENNINFLEQQRIPKIGVPDFIIEPNICIFADGNYWHEKPAAIIKDKKQTKKLEKLGYTVLRFWGSELRKTPEECLTKILEVL